MNQNPTPAVLRLTTDRTIEPANPLHRRYLKRLATQNALAPECIVRLTHRGGLVVYRLDRLHRFRLMTEYRCL